MAPGRQRCRRPGVGSLGRAKEIEGETGGFRPHWFEKKPVPQKRPKEKGEVMVMMQRKRGLWVLYLGGADYEVPVLLQAGSPPSKTTLEAEAARARAALRLPDASHRLRALPLLCHRGVLYVPEPLALTLPGRAGCSEKRVVSPGRMVRLY